MGRNISKKPEIVAAGHICLDITPAFLDKNKKTIGELLLPGRLLQMGGADVHTGGAVANTGLAVAGRMHAGKWCFPSWRITAPGRA